MICFRLAVFPVVIYIFTEKSTTGGSFVSQHTDRRPMVSESKWP